MTTVFNDISASDALIDDIEEESEYDDIFEIKSKLLEMPLELSRANETEPWQMSDLQKVLNNLKTNKTRDS